MIIKVTKLVSPEVYIHGKEVPVYVCEKGDLYASLKQDTLEELGINLFNYTKTLHVVEKERRDLTMQFSKTKHYLVHGYNLMDVCSTLRKLGDKSQLEVASFLEEVIKS